MTNAVNSDPARLFQPGAPSYEQYAVRDDSDTELGPCHICDGEADGECVICDQPVCDDDARIKDHDRFCARCAPGPRP